MKKTKLAFALSSILLSSSALATNGTNLIGIGAKSTALGGTGVAAYFGAENLLANPALIGKSQGTELIFGGTVFMPDVRTEHNMNDFATFAGGESEGDANGIYRAKSDGDLFVVPSAAFSSRINENMVYGIGMFGTSGLGAEYQDNKSMFNGHTALQILRFAPSLTFHNEVAGIGFSPIIQYGALDINYTNPLDGTNVGKGVADDIAFGYSVGGYYDVIPGLTLAAAYTSAINMDYKGQLTTAAGPFNAFGFSVESDELEQPAEMKLGAAYEIGNMMFTADARRIMWGDAKGYKDFGWQDQDVYSIGAKYATKDYWIGAGYNYGEMPIEEQDGRTGAGAAANFFNNTYFPATTESHVTFGGGVAISKRATLEGAFAYAPEVTHKMDVTALQLDPINGDPQYTETKHSQTSATMMIRYNFE
ncbi:MAG: outer membrane protein transport protein [Thiotrichales bacterium]|nr:outer membrane protein transport protein [Thiotrichales bacterium]